MKRFWLILIMAVSLAGFASTASGAPKGYLGEYAMGDEITFEWQIPGVEVGPYFEVYRDDGDYWKGLLDDGPFDQNGDTYTASMPLIPYLGFADGNAYVIRAQARVSGLDVFETWTFYIGNVPGNKPVKVGRKPFVQ